MDGFTENLLSNDEYTSNYWDGNMSDHYFRRFFRIYDQSLTDGQEKPRQEIVKKYKSQSFKIGSS